MEGLAELIRGAKSEYWSAKRSGDEDGAEVWKVRVERMGGLVEGLLGEIKVSEAAGAVRAAVSDRWLINSFD